MRWLILTIVALAAPTALAQTAQFIGLGHLDGPYPASTATGVSLRGEFVAGTSRSWNGFWGEAFRWDAERGLVGLGLLPGHNQSHTGAISPEGDWVVGYGVAEPEHWEAFAWSADTGMFGLGDLPGGAHHSVARSVSTNGRVIVGEGTIVDPDTGRDTVEAYRWTDRSGMVGLGMLSSGGGTPNSTAYGVSADGRVIVGNSSSDEGLQAFRWTESTGMVGLGAVDHERPASTARAVSNNGRWAVGTSTSYQDDGDTNQQAVMWTPEGELIELGWGWGDVFRTFARDVTDDGSIVVGSAYGIQDTGAFFWTPDEGMRNIEDVLRDDYNLDIAALGWDLHTLTSITPDGLTLAGMGTSPDGFSEPFLIRLPAPGSLAPLAAAALLAARRRR